MTKRVVNAFFFKFCLTEDDQVTPLPRELLKRYTEDDDKLFDLLIRNPSVLDTLFQRSSMLEVFGSESVIKTNGLSILECCRSVISSD